jgi:hypothetical protein
MKHPGILVAALYLGGLYIACSDNARIQGPVQPSIHNATLMLIYHAKDTVATAHYPMYFSSVDFPSVNIYLWNQWHRLPYSEKSGFRFKYDVDDSGLVVIGQWSNVADSLTFNFQIIY